MRLLGGTLREVGLLKQRLDTLPHVIPDSVSPHSSKEPVKSRVRSCELLDSVDDSRPLIYQEVFQRPCCQISEHPRQGVPLQNL
jgi:hypothetical protein